MANGYEKINKEGLEFYPAVQIGFAPGQEVWALRDRTFENVGSAIVEVYDKKEDEIHVNCTVDFVRDKAYLSIPGQEPINLMDGNNWINPFTPRYWMTNTNYD